jgi:predicted RNA-binding protein with PIN domain
VEAALEVARRGPGDDPPVAPPAVLRRYLGFTRLSSTVLQAIARAVDGDDEFRARVAGAVDEAEVGRAGWLWLHRPDGYLDEIRKLEDEAEAVAAAEAADREERDARRKLASAQAAADRAVAASRAHAQEIDDLRAELLGERNLRAEVEARLAEVDDELDRVRTERARAVRQLKDVEARSVERAVELKRLRSRLREVDAERDLAAGGPVAGAPVGRPADAPPAGKATARGGAAGGLPAAADESRGRPPGGEPSESVEPPEPPAPPGAARSSEAVGPGFPATTAGAGAGPPPEPVVDAAALARALRSAARGAAELAAALGEIEGVVAALQPEDGTAARPPGAAGLGVGAGPGTGTGMGTGTPAPAVAAGERAGGEAAPPRRVPLPLPAGLLDDSVEAVEHLLRAPGLLLLIDGYNVSMTGWPDLPVVEQRRRLLGALGEVAARTGTEVDVVFDGADVEPLSPPHQVRQLVRVRFSPPHVEADDVLLDLLGQIPAARPVVVASSDNRVREGARRRGANLAHARQLVGLLRR